MGGTIDKTITYPVTVCNEDRTILFRNAFKGIFVIRPALLHVLAKVSYGLTKMLPGTQNYFGHLP